MFIISKNIYKFFLFSFVCYYLKQELINTKENQTNQYLEIFLKIKYLIKINTYVYINIFYFEMIVLLYIFNVYIVYHLFILVVVI